PTLPVFPNQHLERQINGDGGRRNHQRRPTLGIAESDHLRRRHLQAAFSASPLWSMRQNIASPWACSKDSANVYGLLRWAIPLPSMGGTSCSSRFVKSDHAEFPRRLDPEGHQASSCQDDASLFG